MKVLFLTPQIPYPPHKGTAARNFNLLKHVAGKHEVHLLTFADAEGRGMPEQLARLCTATHVVATYLRPKLTRVREMLTTATPDLALRLASAQMTRKLAEVVLENEFDLVQIEGLEMSLHWERLRTWGLFRGSGRPLVVFDDHNCEYLLQKRAFEIDRVNPTRWLAAAYSLAQWLRLARFEGRFARTADGVVCVSEEDERALRAVAGARPVAVVQNGVDTGMYARRDGQPGLATGGPNLVFTGTMDFRPNVDAVSWFCRHILGRIRRAVPEAEFLIVGANPTEEVKRLSKLEGVVVTGYVEDVRQFLDRATVYVVPMRFGGGVRFKVLEAMASGLPVVSTSMGCQGISAREGNEILFGDTAKDFADAVVRLLSDAGLRRTLGSNARDLVAQTYDWKAILPKIDDFYVELASSRCSEG